MLPHNDVVAEVMGLPDGPQIGAFFDFDGTIISGYSVMAFIKEQVRRGHLSPRELVELLSAMASFGLGGLGFSGMMVAATQFLRGIREDSYANFGEELFESHIARLIYPESRALIQAHLKKGHTVAIITSATPYQVRPAARELGIEHVLCTELEVKDGVFTGAVVQPLCFGPGKVTAAEMLSQQFNVDLEKSYFYSDSHDDIQLLERVGNPRPLNPGNRLLAIAEQRGWPVRKFGSRGQPEIATLLRSAMMPVSLIGSFLAGFPIWALTGSKRDALNFSVSLFADTASALIGLNLKTVGEQHLYSHRPAVFIFNHQSNVDLVIVSRLLRRDIIGVGKREIRDIPIVGRVMESAGVVLIDRHNSESAIKVMTQLADTMRIEGKSVCVSPEGTRAVTPKLASFKKGAFHLAIQAGVPVVPIVIHNSTDVQPKGDYIFHPGTVKVEVLPPVDTSKWSADTIDLHVDEVRNMYLKALDQMKPLENV
ncbi:MAG: HAD-IB family hydrolase [Gammaproteobacteria bacterium]|nr:HAD-IB family hydrolase [Gammaproteobacteria bacterium]MDH5242222.1 HAD-IB family hydrolase [Gammaproteobacteria bacterium]MDH5261860.1 HAD-IB family hydrolase [Gammaproteobacteria bacterium]MDH5621996.1 HAD-IB family hydrolase [Gammaproteobacteria bacterium]